MEEKEFDTQRWDEYAQAVKDLFNMKQDALNFLESHKKREYIHDRHSIDCECIEYVPLHIAKMALDMVYSKKINIFVEKIS